MNYIIIEQQTSNGVTSAMFTVKGTFNEAEQQYHTVLAAAAVSDVPIHSATMLNERGQIIKYECYDHTEVVSE